MAKGAQSKIDTYAKLTSVFPNSFMYNDGKELRIPLVEDGAEIQLKLVLTCAKDNVKPGGDVAIPGAEEPNVSAPAQEQEGVSLTDEEKNKVKELMKNLGI